MWALEKRREGRDDGVGGFEGQMDRDMHGVVTRVSLRLKKTKTPRLCKHPCPLDYIDQKIMPS